MNKKELEKRVEQLERALSLLVDELPETVRDACDEAGVSFDIPPCVERFGLSLDVFVGGKYINVDKFKDIKLVIDDNEYRVESFEVSWFEDR